MSAERIVGRGGRGYVEQAVCTQISEKAGDHREHGCSCCSNSLPSMRSSVMGPSIFLSAGVPLSGLVASLVVNVVNLAFTFVMMVVIDKLGRRALLFVGSHWDVSEHDDGRCVGPVDSPCGSTWRHFHRWGGHCLRACVSTRPSSRLDGARCLGSTQARFFPWT